jgi:hypothetical protein
MNIEIKSIFGSVLFTTDAETIKEAVIKAVSTGANLTGADLIDANLTGADLRGADLRGADLRGANLTGADLIDANLTGANLTGADLRGADIENTRLPIYCKWSVSYNDKYDTIYIGCKADTIEGWDAFFASDIVYDTPRDTDDFKRIRANYEAVRAYCLIMKS